MIETIRAKVHEWAEWVKKKWLVVLGVVASLAPELPTLIDNVQSVDFTGMTLRAAATSVGLITLRFAILRAVIYFTPKAQ